MAHQITQLSDKGYIVNGKAVYQNEAGIWIPEHKFEWFEINLFKKHLNALQPNVKHRINNVV